MNTMKPHNIFIIALVIIGLVFASGYVSWKKRQVASEIQSSINNPKKAELIKRNLISKRIILPNTHMLGSRTATVVLTQFSDYACPSCAVGWLISQKLIEDFKNDPRFAYAFRQSPIQIHPNAQKAAETTEAAGTQGKFWEMHSLLFEKQDEWVNVRAPLDFFVQYATGLGLDAAVFKELVQSGRLSYQVNTDREDAKRYNINKTPTFFINDTQYEGVLSYQELKLAVERALQQ